LTPNIVHFVWLTGPNARAFSFVNYLAVRAAHAVQTGCRVLMHVNCEPVGNPNWERIRPYVEMVHAHPPTEHNGFELTHVQYQADVLRLKILLEHGGIYLDTDMLLLEPVKCGKGCTLSPDTVGKARSINAGVIAVDAGNPFVQRWLDAFAVTDVWAYGAVVLPWELVQQDRTGVTLARAEELMPFTWEDKAILTPDWPERDARCVHMWETIWSADLAQIDDYYLRTSDSAFARLFKQYAWRPRICVYAIAKNEEMFVNRFCEAAADADRLGIKYGALDRP